MMRFKKCLNDVNVAWLGCQKNWYTPVPLSTFCNDSTDLFNAHLGSVEVQVSIFAHRKSPPICETSHAVCQVRLIPYRLKACKAWFLMIVWLLLWTEQARTTAWDSEADVKASISSQLSTQVSNESKATVWGNKIKGHSKHKEQSTQKLVMKHESSITVYIKVKTMWQWGNRRQKEGKTVGHKVRDRKSGNRDNRWPATTNTGNDRWSNNYECSTWKTRLAIDEDKHDNTRNKRDE